MLQHKTAIRRKKGAGATDLTPSAGWFHKHVILQASGSRRYAARPKLEVSVSQSAFITLHSVITFCCLQICSFVPLCHFVCDCVCVCVQKAVNVLIWGAEKVIFSLFTLSLHANLVLLFTTVLCSNITAVQACIICQFVIVTRIKDSFKQRSGSLCFTY